MHKNRSGVKMAHCVLKSREEGVDGTSPVLKREKDDCL